MPPVSLTGVTIAYQPPNPLGQIKWSALDGTVDEEICTSYERPIGIDTPPCLAIFHCESMTGLAAGPSVSIGTNAPDYDNIVPTTDLGSLTSPGDYVVRMVGSKLVPVAWDTPLTIRVRSRRNAAQFVFGATLICFPMA